MKTAKDLMTEDPFSYSLNQSVSKLVELFIKHQMASIPIVDEQNRPIGIIRDYAIAKIYIIHHYNDKVKQREDKVLNYKSMIDDPSIVNDDDSISEVIQKLNASGIKRLLVIERSSGKLCGLISPIDILRFINGEEKSTQTMHKDFDELRNEVVRLQSEVDKLEDDLDVYSNVFDDSPFMMHAVDSKGKILMANHVMHEVLGYNAGELVGKTIYDIYPESQHKLAEEGIQVIMGGGKFESTFTSMVRRDKWLVPVDMASSAVYDDGERFRSTITISRVLESQDLQKGLHEASYIDIKDEDELSKKAA